MIDIELYNITYKFDTFDENDLISKYEKNI